MHKLFIAILFTLVFPNTYTVVTDSSIVEWIGNKVSGSHNGYINLSSGQVILKDKKIEKSELFIDMKTITNSDITNEGSRNYLVNHLKSDDFFDVENFPNSHISFIQSAEDSTSTLLTCDITIKGITNRIKFPVKIILTDDIAIASGTATIDRTKHNIKYKSKTFFKEIGDRFIYDNFTLNFSIYAKLDKGK
tara:strand:+ start:1711 stop:2286 length:576 start_codon:yes stop_codon:yes gene_type:complete